MPVSAPSLTIANANSLVTALAVNVGQTQLQSLSVTSLTVSGASTFATLSATSGTISTTLGFSSGSYTTTLAGSGSATANVNYVLPVSDGLYGQVLATNGVGVLSWITAPVGGGVATYTKTLNLPGPISVYTGNVRWYPDTSITLTQVYVTVSSPPVGASAQFVLRKNGTSFQTVTVLNGEYKSSLVPITQTLLTTDYITVDVLVASGCQDAAISILYTR